MSDQDHVVTNTVIIKKSGKAAVISDVTKPNESEMKLNQSTESLSRCSSLASLAHSIYSSPVSVGEVRSLTDKYQKMLAQATQEIKSLNMQKTNLEVEQERLLTVNIELATEAKRLVSENKMWKAEQTNLIAANEEFSQEVKKLYREEELWEQETLRIKAEAKEISQKYEQDLKLTRYKFEEEKEKSVKQIENLLESVKVLTNDNARLLEERDKETLNSSKSHEDLKEDYNKKILKLETTIVSLKSELDTEQILKREVESQIQELSISLKKMEQQFRIAKQEQQKDIQQQKETFERKIRTLEIKSENLAAENFEFAVDNENLKKQIQRINDEKKKIEKEIHQLNVENKWLANNKKKSSGVSEKMEDMERELHNMKRELKEEKEKVPFNFDILRLLILFSLRLRTYQNGSHNWHVKTQT